MKLEEFFCGEKKINKRELKNKKEEKKEILGLKWNKVFWDIMIKEFNVSNAGKWMRKGKVNGKKFVKKKTGGGEFK